MRVLLIGSQGQLGKVLLRVFPNADVLTGDVAKASNAILASKAECVINTTAYTDMDKAETDAKECFRVNTHAVAEMAAACAVHGKLFVHFSTVCVLDDMGLPVPKSVYGRSKLWGEQLIAKSGCQHVIIRTDCLYSETTGFVGKVLSNINAGKSLQLPTNICGNPTHVEYLVSEVLDLLDNGFRGATLITGEHYKSRYDWALSFVPADKHRLITPVTVGATIRPKGYSK